MPSWGRKEGKTKKPEISGVKVPLLWLAGGQAKVAVFMRSPRNGSRSTQNPRAWSNKHPLWQGFVQILGVSQAPTSQKPELQPKSTPPTSAPNVYLRHISSNPSFTAPLLSGVYKHALVKHVLYYSKHRPSEQRLGFSRSGGTSSG